MLHQLKGYIALILFICVSPKSFSTPQPSIHYNSNYSGHLELIIGPAIRYIDWTTPRTALWSALDAQIVQDWENLVDTRGTIFSVGHVVVHFQCIDTQGVQRNIWTGATGQNNSNETDQDVYEHEIGLGALFKEYKDGTLNSQKKSLRQILNYSGRSEISPYGQNEELKPKFIMFPITALECEKVYKYYRLFERHGGWSRILKYDDLKQKNPQQILHFGFDFNPYQLYSKSISGERVKLGAGCSSFGKSFIELIGEFDPSFDYFWKRTLNISENLIGNADNKNIESNLQRRVPLSSLLFGAEGGRWSHPGFKIRKLEFYDVELMWRFIAGVQTCRDYISGMFHPRLLTNGLPLYCTPQLLEWVKSRWQSINAYSELNLLEERNSLAYYKNDKINGIIINRSSSHK